MFDWINHLGSEGLLPHGQCYLWDAPLIWLHAISDALIAIAYFSIPIFLIYFIRKRIDLPYPWVFLMFGVFIVSCGITHAIDVWVIWQPAYWISGGMKAVTALVSLATVFGIMRIIPGALALPSPADLRRANENLDQKVAAQTAELRANNERLQAAIAEREAAETEVRRLNLSLNERIAELQTLIEFMPIGVAVSHDPQCEEIVANKTCAELLGMPARSNVSLTAPADRRPAKFRVFSNDAELASEELPMQRAVRENRPIIDFPERLERADGVTLELLVSAVPLRNSEGEATGCVATFQDLTQRNRQAAEKVEFEQRFRETQKLESLGVLAGGIAHDFNNLLTGVLGHASLVRRFIPPDDHRIDQSMEQIEKAANRAADLCKQLLAYAGKGKFQEHPLKLEELVRDTLALLEVSISKRAVLKVKCASDVPPIQADEIQLRQVLMNLVINAAEATAAHTEERGVIRIEISEHEFAESDMQRLALHQELLEVSDDGCGMTQDQQARVFEPFYTTKFTGRGLGLSAVLGIMRGHRGGIKLYSEPEKGTTFKLLFPSVLTAPTHSRPPFELPHSGWTGKGHILVADDEESVRTVAKQMLEHLGFSVSTAEDGKIALRLIDEASEPFRLLLVDLTMPHCNGEQFVRELRSRGNTTPILLMSGFNEQTAVSRFVGRGTAGFVPKPFSLSSMTKSVRAVLK